MGVGKTVQALCISYLFKNEWPLLIITPSSLKYTWQDEIYNWLTEFTKEDVQVVKGSKDEIDENKLIYICSYDIATKLTS